MIYPAGNDFHLTRRATLRTVGAAAVLAVGSGNTGLTGAAQAATATPDSSARNAAGFWPNGARLAVSFSLMFEGGGQPISGAGGVIPDKIEDGVPDLPTARPDGQARDQAPIVHDRQSGRDLARPRPGDRA